MFWFTADLHLGMPYTVTRRRPFATPEDADKTMLKNIKSVVAEDDTLVVIGDLFDYSDRNKETWSQMGSKVKRLKRNIKLLLGNNEERIIKEQFGGSRANFKYYCKNFNIELIDYQTTVKIGKLPFLCVHKPENANKSILNLYGHVHNAGQVGALGLNVAQDVNGFFPVSEAEIARRIYVVANHYDKSIKESTNIKDLSLFRKYYHDTKHLLQGGL